MAKKARAERLLGCHCSIAGGVQNAPLAAGRLGANAVQLFTGSNQQWHTLALKPGQVEAFRKNMEEQGIIAAVSHACYLINLAAPDRAIYAKSVKAMTGEIERAALLGIPWVIVHPGSHRENGLEWGIKRVALSLERVFDATSGLSTGVALETTAGQGSSIGRSFRELAAIIEALSDSSRVAVCFDTCHAFAAGYELRTKQGYAKTWREFESELGMKRLVAMHLNDSKGEIGSHIDRHTHIGEGRIGIPGFRLIMNDQRFSDVPMLLETPKEADADEFDRRNFKVLRSLISG